MVSRTGSAAYAGSVRLHCALGLLGVLLCGLATAWLTGAYRLPSPPHRAPLHRRGTRAVDRGHAGRHLVAAIQSPVVDLLLSESLFTHS
jgi:hypothetical protein